MIRVVVVGARCHRRGIGEFITRSLHDAGVSIAGIVGTSEATVAQALNTLYERHLIRTAGYTSLVDALEKERPQLVAICSPHAAHRTQLEQVAHAGLHCLCEKPLWWGDDMEDAKQATERLATTFVAQGRLLDLVTQWPFTLNSFDALHPGVRQEPVQSFEMLLSPTASGEAMLPEAFPHVSSLLYALVGSGEVTDSSTRYSDGIEQMMFSFRYRHKAGSVNVTCRFVTTPGKPRPAAYAINGHWIHRTVRLSDYAIAFECDGRAVPAADPLDMLIRNFVYRVEAGESTNVEKLINGMMTLQAVAGSAARAVPTARS